MKFIKLAIPFISALVCTHGHAIAGVVLGSELSNFSIFSGTYVSTGDGATVYGNLLASTYGTTGANSTIFGNFQSGDVGTAGAYATVFGNFQSFLDGTTGANSTINGNFQAGSTGTTGANAIINGNFLSGGAGTTGANSIITGSLKAGGVVTQGEGATAGSVGIPTLADTTILQNAMTSKMALVKGQVVAAQSALTSMGTGTALAATITVDTIFNAGVYSAASWSTTAGTTLFLDGQNQADQTWIFNITDSLSTGASTKIELINSGANSHVFWNTGGYASLGASSTFIGDIFATTYISVGADAYQKNLLDSACGGLFSATSYVSVGAGAQIGSGGCAASTSITSSVPEPETYSLLLAGLALVTVFKRRHTAKTA
jgi:hypothetical protein